MKKSKNIYKDSFPGRIREARRKTGFTQEETSRETGIARSNISKYENGELEPTLEALGTLAEFYQISTDWLLGIGQQNKERKEKTIEEKERYTILKDTDKTALKENRKAN